MVREYGAQRVRLWSFASLVALRTQRLREVGRPGCGLKGVVALLVRDLTGADRFLNGPVRHARQFCIFHAGILLGHPYMCEGICCGIWGTMV